MLTYRIGDYYADGKRLLEVVDADDRSPYVHLRDVCSTGGAVVTLMRTKVSRDLRRVVPASPEEMFGCADPSLPVPVP